MSRRKGAPYLFSALVVVHLAGLHLAFSAERGGCAAAAGVTPSSVRAKSTSNLLRLLSDDCVDEMLNESSGLDRLSLVEREVSRRRPTKQLLTAFRSAAGRSPYRISGLLEEIGDTEVDRGLQRLAGQDTGLHSYLALKYFAKRGRMWALKTLNDHYLAYPVSSAEWAGIAELFGTYRYRPAAENLARSVGTASLNLGWAAHESLGKIFPEAAEAAGKLDTPEKAQEYWIRHVQKQRARQAPDGGP